MHVAIILLIFTPADSYQKQKIRPARAHKSPSEAAGTLQTNILAPKLQTQVPVANMPSPGDPSAQALVSRALNLPSTAAPTQLPSPVTDNDTDQDTEMTESTVEATPADENTASVWVHSIEEGVRQLSKLHSLTKAGRPDFARKPTTAEIQSYIKNARAYLLHLEHEVEPKPHFKQKLGLDTALRFYLPPKLSENLRKMAPDIPRLAQEVLDKYDSEDWGKDLTNHEEEEIDADDMGPAVAPSCNNDRQSSGSSSSAYTEVIQLPPASHPIWGRQGIMHGLARRTTKKGRVVVFLDPRYQNMKRKAKVFGHNGHVPGAWWPYQKAALFHGAHGAPQAGITGDPGQGTFSIVVSATSVYRDLNQDMGTELWYSAGKSTENASPVRAGDTSNPTRSLEIAREKGTPVRVLRHAGITTDPHRSPIYPTVGIRYDGLYKVVELGTGTNNNNGVFKRFRLVRLPDSENEGVSWEDVQKYPTREQLRQFDQIKDGY